MYGREFYFTSVVLTCSVDMRRHKVGVVNCIWKTARRMGCRQTMSEEFLNWNICVEIMKLLLASGAAVLLSILWANPRRVATV